MAKKRGQGEGSISQLPDGRWWARITIGKDENGKQKRKAFYGKSKKEVQEQLYAALRGENPEVVVKSGVITVERWIDTWLHDYKKIAVRASTYERDSRFLSQYILPKLGKYALKDLKSDMVQEVISEMVKKGYSYETIQKSTGLFKSCLSQAVKNDLIKKNVALSTVLPKKHRKKRPCLSREEQKIFINAAKQQPYGEIFILILATGLRIGEALALNWSDINFDEETLYVNKTVSSSKDPDTPNAKRILVCNPPKTKSSKRTIPLLPVIVTMLKAIQQKQIIAAKTELGDSLVFPDESGGMIWPEIARYGFKRILKVADLKAEYSPHCLRHTFATRGLENGIPLKVMQELLGHSSIRMTADLYTHVLPDTKKDAISQLEDAFKPQSIEVEEV